MNTPAEKNSSQALIDNLQRTNGLIRSRAIVLCAFLIFMIGFALSINKTNRERDQLNADYDRLVALLQTDSMSAILKRDSIQYFYDSSSLGSYMSLEVLFDKLAADSFKNREPLYAAIDHIDELWRINGRKKTEGVISILGFTTPIEPIILIGPILLLLLYHDLCVTMLYRLRVENEMRKSQIDYLLAGPETVGHFSLEHIPHNLRYLKWLWSVFQIIILFLPIVPAVYLCLYSGDTTPFLVIVNVLCCLGILIDFLILVDSENIMRLRDFSLMLTGSRPLKSSKNPKKDKAIIAGTITVLMGLATWLSLSDLLTVTSDLWLCIFYATLSAALMSVFSIVIPEINKKSLRVVVSILISAGFFMSLYWGIIDLLAAIGAIQFRFLGAEDYIVISILIFLAAVISKFIYLLVYLPEDDNNAQQDLSNVSK